VYTLAADDNVVLSESKAVTLLPQYTFDKVMDHDIIIIPGRVAFDGKSSLIPADKPVIEWIKKKGHEWKHKADEKVIMSVCVGLYTLADTGLLDGKNATTHYMAIDYARQTWPKIDIIENVRYVTDGLFVSTGGITSGIDGALSVVARFNGPDVAQSVADVMVYTMNAPLPPDTILPLKS